ncbi:MAG: hypothetical protein WBL61_20620 [Bryobacteraceae bacterium]
MKRIVLALALLAASRLPAADTSVPPVAQKFLGLFQELREAGTARGSSGRHVSFALSDDEINEYMRYSLRATPRPGVDSVTVKIFPQNYISTFTVVDFDAVERWKPGTIPYLLRPILRGKQSVWLDYRFAAANSTATFSVEKAYYDKIRLPAFFVEKMIQILAARQPEHYDTSKPVPLPFGLRQVWTENHVAKGNN